MWAGCGEFTCTILFRGGVGKLCVCLFPFFLLLLLERTPRQQHQLVGLESGSEGKGRRSAGVDGDQKHRGSNELDERIL